MNTTAWNWIKGTVIKAGDRLVDELTVVLVEPGQVEIAAPCTKGAKFADLHLSNDKCRRVWEGHQYRIEGSVVSADQTVALHPWGCECQQCRPAVTPA